MSFNYIVTFKNKNNSDNYKMDKDKDKDNTTTKSNEVTTCSDKKRKHTTEKITQQNKKYKRGNGGNTDEDSESEHDYDYIPSDCSTETSSDSDSYYESETESNSECEKNNKRSRSQESLRPQRKAAKGKKYKEDSTDSESDTSDNSDEERKKNIEDEYENYLEKLAKEMGDNIYKNVKDKRTEEKENTKNNQNKKNDLKSDNKIGQIFIISQAPSDKMNKEKKYKLRHKSSEYEFLSTEQKNKIDETEKELFELNRHKIPPRHKILLSDMTLDSKAKIIENMERMNNMNSYSSEYTKLCRWIDGVLKIPFGTYYEIPISLSSPNKEICSYMSNIETSLDKCIYGQRSAKEKILEFVGKWITNQSSTNEPLAFIGEKGTGKTTLAKEGIAKALGRPFYMISLGGESDAASFKGHDYTYEGSRWGRIVDILIATQCMNPVIFFDELDKLSTTRAGEEIAGMLMHLTDTTQNDRFSDKYFSGIDFDLSKAMFIFSYNDPHKLNPILRDRLTEIKFNSFKKNDKVIIAKKFLIKRACENIGLKYDDYIFPEDTITTLIERYTANEESGVRSLKRIIETLFLRINLYQLPQTLNISYRNLKMKQTGGKYKIGERVVSELLKDMIPVTSQAVLSIYT